MNIPKLKIGNVEFSRKRFKTYFGNIGELIAEEVLFREGFEVWGLRPYYATAKAEREILGSVFQCLSFLYPSGVRIYDEALGYEKNRELAIKKLDDFFGEKLVNFEKYIESIGVLGKAGIIGAARIRPKGQSKHVYTPDIVCKKGDDIYIVEVKTNSASIYLKPEKVRGLLLARKFGLIPLVIHLNIGTSASDFTMYELE